MPIIIFTGIVVIFGILFYLYDIPFDAIIYGCELSFVWCAVCLFIDFYKYYKRHKLLHINREQFFDDAEQLPEHMDIIEYDYQELAKELYQAKQELISKNRLLWHVGSSDQNTDCCIGYFIAKYGAIFI